MAEGRVTVQCSELPCSNPRLLHSSQLGETCPCTPDAVGGVVFAASTPLPFTDVNAVRPPRKERSTRLSPQVEYENHHGKEGDQVRHHPAESVPFTLRLRPPHPAGVSRQQRVRNHDQHLEPGRPSRIGNDHGLGIMASVSGKQDQSRYGQNSKQRHISQNAPPTLGRPHQQCKP